MKCSAEAKRIVVAIASAADLSGNWTINGAFALTLTLTGQNGVYHILATTNLGLSLNTWTVAATVTNSTGTFQFTDTNAANLPFQYYRAVLIP